MRIYQIYNADLKLTEAYFCNKENADEYLKEVWHSATQRYELNEIETADEPEYEIS